VLTSFESGQGETRSSAEVDRVIAGLPQLARGVELYFCQK